MPDDQNCSSGETASATLSATAAAQLIAYVENGLFRTSARRANMLAARLASGVRDLPGATLAAPVEANEVFLELPEAAIDGLIADGFLFYRRTPGPPRVSVRRRGEGRRCLRHGCRAAPGAAAQMTARAPAPSSSWPPEDVLTGIGDDLPHGGRVQLVRGLADSLGLWLRNVKTGQARSGE